MKTITEHMQRTAEALRRNHMEAYCVATKEEVLPLCQTLLKAGDTVAVGGSRTLEETGILTLLREGDYRFLDRYANGLTPEKTREIFLQSLGADVYFTSSNAVTQRGELYNVDGNGNRVAALCYGPRSVVVIVGCNKLVADLPEAQRRVKTIAAPQNAVRLHCDTYCAKTGSCAACNSEYATDGCSASGRICSTYVMTGYQRNAGRIKVILVGEPLGF